LDNFRDHPDLTLTLQFRLVQLVDVALDLGVEILATPVQELAPALTQDGQVILLVVVMQRGFDIGRVQSCVLRLPKY
jgi:hypothetical protein